jgi:hypothetical protein
MKSDRLPRLRLAVSIAAATCACVAASPAGAAPSSSGCGPHNIVVWLESRGNAGAGSVYYTLRLTNLSTVPCSLGGYPGVSAVDLAGKQLGSASGRNARFPVRTILIAPQGSVRFLLQLNDPGFFPRAGCRPTTAAGLRVYLPNATNASVVPVPFGACSRVGPVFLHATAVTR